MKARGFLIGVAAVLVFGSLCAEARQSAPAPTPPGSGTVVPRLVQFSGSVTDASGKAAAGAVMITFSLYALQDGGAPLWSETQRLALDSRGHYTALLGAASPDGLPLDLFASGAARWLGVAPALPGVGEQTRVLLVGVPYALKAADADTLGGKPASAYVTTDSAGSAGLQDGTLRGDAGTKDGATSATSTDRKTKAPASTITGSGTTNYVPLWTGSTTLGNSALFQTSSGNVGIGTTSPTSILQVNGSSPMTSTGTGAGFSFQDRAGGASPYGEWYSTADVARFWRSDKGDIIGVTSTGNVGIGTTSPTFTLEVSGSTPIYSTGSGAGLAFQDRSGGTSPYAEWYSTGDVARLWWLNKGDILGVTSTGNVGIGTTAPAATLEVNGTAKFDQSVTFASGQTFPNTASLGSNTFTGNQTVTGTVTDSASPSGAAVSVANTATSGQTAAVQGTVSAAAGSGVAGVNVNSSSTGGQHPGYTGVWGDSGQSGNDGVLGTADDGFAMVAYNNSPSGDAPLYVENFNTASGLPLIKAVAGNGTTCIVVNSDGNSFCQGTQSTVVSVDGRERALYTIQAPENWFEDFGSATLDHGVAGVQLEAAFAETVNTGMEYHVFLTPKGDCEGLFVTNETPAGFEVHELRHGQSNVAFDYRIVARRKGYEGVRLADETKEMETPAPGTLSHAYVAVPPSRVSAAAAHAH